MKQRENKKMNAINKYIAKALVVFSALSLFSCTDFLDQLPDNRTELDNEESIRNLLVTAYPEMSHILMAELMSDNATDLGPSYSTFNTWHTDIYNWEPVIEDGQDTPASFWEACYAAVATANHALAAIEELGSPEELNPHRGEALMCRAYSEFMLVNIFAQHYNPNTADSDLGVPYPLEPETTVLADYARESVARVYELIEQDITEGLSLISNSLYDVPKFHFTIQAANAFASRFYLFKGDWANALKYADLALGDNPATYLRDWYGYDEMTVNEFLEYYTRSTEPSNLMMVGAVSWWARVVRSYRYGMTVEIQDDFYGYFDGEHPWGGGLDTTAKVRINSGTYAMKNIYTVGTDIWFTPKWDEKFRYAYSGASTGYGYIMQYVFTGEEVLLNRAEANIMLGNTQAGIDDLNLWVETHCPNPGSIPGYLEEYYENNPPVELNPWFDVTDDNNLLIHAVLDIRRREFAHDGLRWFDIKRYNFEIEHKVYGSENLVLAPDDDRRAVQIPQDAINQGIEPNPMGPDDTDASDYIKAGADDAYMPNDTIY